MPTKFSVQKSGSGTIRCLRRKFLSHLEILSKCALSLKNGFLHIQMGEKLVAADFDYVHSGRVPLKTNTDR